MSNAARRDAPPGNYAANHVDGTLKHLQFVDATPEARTSGIGDVHLVPSGNVAARLRTNQPTGGEIQALEHPGLADDELRRDPRLRVVDTDLLDTADHAAVDRLDRAAEQAVERHLHHPPPGIARAIRRNRRSMADAG